MKKIQIKVIPNAKKVKIAEDKGTLKVYVNVPAVDGKANKALTEVLARHFGVKRRNISILSGEKSRSKIIGVSSVVASVLKPR
ncbi:MAG: DUF167 domain-containing protein [Candidatus Margulisiibacteriota bacterium]